MKYYEHKPVEPNVGDSLSGIILKHFLSDYKLREVGKREKGKLVSCGSVMSMVHKGDVVWGTGCIRKREIRVEDVKFLAVRGRLTKKQIKKSFVPDIFGDPALLLPLIYNPKVEKKHKEGIVPHYVDKDRVKKGKIINVSSNWKEFIKEIKSCERIISSSLHGIIIAEAYGIPAIWGKFGGKLSGNNFKFYDYMTGTDREIQEPFQELKPFEIKKIQQRLISSLRADIPIIIKRCEP